MATSSNVNANPNIAQGVARWLGRANDNGAGHFWNDHVCVRWNASLDDRLGISRSECPDTDPEWNCFNSAPARHACWVRGL